MIGTGYVGLVSGTCFADIGNHVICVDKDKNKIEKLNAGISPIYEPGLNELIKKNYSAKRLFFTTDLKKAISLSDIIFICVGTPNKKGSLKVDLSFVYKCCQSYNLIFLHASIFCTNHLQVLSSKMHYHPVLLSLLPFDLKIVFFLSYCLLVVKFYPLNCTFYISYCLSCVSRICKHSICLFRF